ncbi:MAG: S9 family peptidase, partial [Thermoanaerobaculia bacterium]
MKRFAAIVLLTASTVLAQQHPMTFNDLAAIRRIATFSLSPDGKWIAYEASTIDLPANYRHSAIYLVPAAGGASRKVTDGVKQDEGPAWSPDGKTIAYVSNRDGDPKQIYLYDVAANTSRKLTNLQGGAASVKWLPDGSGLVAVSDIYPDCGVDPACIKTKTDAEKNAPTQARIITNLLYRHWKAWQEATRAHIVLVPLSGSPRDLTAGEFDAPPYSLGGGDEFDVSPDGKQLVFARNTDKDAAMSTNSDLFIVSTAGGAPIRITTRQGADTAPKYSPDGKWIAYRSQARAGYESDEWELWIYNRATGDATRIAPEFPNWIESLTWAPDSRKIYFTAPEKGKIAIYEVTLEGRFTPVFVKGSADAVTAAPDGKTIFFDWASLQHPTEIYSLTRSTGAVTTITHDNDELIQRINRGDVSDMTWVGADGAQIQGFLVKPPDFDATKKYPALVLIHGGPQSAWSDNWSYRWNPLMFAARGYVVLMPNPRGSVGFGQLFTEQISGDWGGRVYTDIMNGVDKLAGLPYVDATRMGAAGAS